jgi:phosphoglycerol transferase MdoB-like AlkP superfamily enzyme
MKPLFREVSTSAQRRFLPLYVYAGILVLLSLATRIVLLARADTVIEASASDLARIFGMGLFFDLVAASYFCLPFTLYLTFLPSRVARWKAHVWLFLAAYLAFIYLLMVVAVSEWVFWDEFAGRFNFIAVDYLVYTNEVLGNIWQSYPVGRWLALLAIPALLMWFPLRRLLGEALAHPAPFGTRLKAAAPLLLAPLLAFYFVNTEMRRISAQDAANDLAGNGIYEFFAANYNNELSFDRFYAVLPHEQAMQTTRQLIGGTNARWIDESKGGLNRVVEDPAPDRRLNVVLVSIESLGAEFLGSFGNKEGITPFLDALAAESLSFTQVYATGNRTVRGMEALALSIPPTPGQSIVKRPHNEGLFSLGHVFDDHDYDSAYLYGGYGYFDNLNYFFSNNDYRVVDRTALAGEDIHYENIWGVADEDLFTLALREMDRSHKEGGTKKPFFMHVMTTSNHRPYTYPEGRVDIPSGTNRAGAVKYTDFAVGDFLKRAKAHPWFADTIFVITADHGASARGTTEIPLLKYRVPLFFYSPGHVKPGRVDRLMSQIDIAPTLLGQLGWTYPSKFYGHDIFKVPESADRALVANYQTLGYMKDGRLVTLQPQRKVSVAPLPPELGLPPSTGTPTDAVLRDEAISLYQSASYVFGKGLLKGIYKDETYRQKAAGK